MFFSNVFLYAIYLLNFLFFFFLELALNLFSQCLQDLQSITKRGPVQKPKRTIKATGERGPNARKKNKKEEVGKSTETLIKQLKQVKRWQKLIFYHYFLH